MPRTKRLNQRSKRRIVIEEFEAKKKALMMLNKAGMVPDSFWWETA